MAEESGWLSRYVYRRSRCGGFVEGVNGITLSLRGVFGCEERSKAIPRFHRYGSVAKPLHNKQMITYLPIITISIGAWMVLNGVLHDIAVLRSEHGKQYDRNLLRLLMDGHILITCGVMQMISFIGLRHN